MSNSEENARAHLTLLKTEEVTTAEIYGKMFHYLADQIYVAREHARLLYLEALSQDIHPSEFNADYSLVSLYLAEIGNVTDLDGMPKVLFFDPEDERVKSVLMGNDDGCDCDE